VIPSVLTHQLQSTVLDYLQTTFNLSNSTLESQLFEFLKGPEGLLKGPYVDVRLPFRNAAQGEDIPLEVRPAFTPYTHQLVSFRRLTSAEAHDPQDTLVTTGTGSGKTECFHYPILEHCWRHRHERGIKAILLYPMNALANDQARRLAKLLHTHPLLKGHVSAGLCIGGKGMHRATGPDHLIDDRKVLRTAPPDILLTNYRMPDFLLLRPKDQPLWSRNGPDTLRYLVLCSILGLVSRARCPAPTADDHGRTRRRLSRQVPRPPLPSRRLPPRRCGRLRGPLRPLRLRGRHGSGIYALPELDLVRPNSIQPADRASKENVKCCAP